MEFVAVLQKLHLHNIKNKKVLHLQFGGRKNNMRCNVLSPVPFLGAPVWSRFSPGRFGHFGFGRLEVKNMPMAWDDEKLTAIFSERPGRAGWSGVVGEHDMYRIEEDVHFFFKK